MRSVLLLLLPFLLPGQDPRPVIGIGGIIHETNTFNPKKTTVAGFEESIRGTKGILRGQAIIEEFSDANNTTSGFIQGAKEHGLDIYPTMFAGPQTIGTVTDAALDTLTQELIERLQGAPRLDGILLFLHGTMVAESYPTPTLRWCAECAGCSAMRFPLWSLMTFMPTFRQRSLG